MITKERIQEVTEKHFWEEDFFLVDVQMVPGKRITIYVDREQGISIDECVELSRGIHRTLGADLDEYELTVSSPGLDMPLKVPEQFYKNLSRELEVVDGDGMKYKGKLLTAHERGFVLVCLEKQPREGKKGTVMIPVEKSFDYEGIKSARLVISFK